MVRGILGRKVVTLAKCWRESREGISYETWGLPKEVASEPSLEGR